MKKLINMLKNNGLYVFGASFLIASIFATPFICGEISSIVGAIFAAIGNVAVGFMVCSLAVVGQYAINHAREMAKEKNEGKVKEISEEEVHEYREQLEALRKMQQEKEMKKAKRKKVVKVEQNENTNDLSL